MFGKLTWPPFYCFGTPIWPPCRHVKTLHIFSLHPLPEIVLVADKTTEKHSLRALKTLAVFWGWD